MTRIAPENAVHLKTNQNQFQELIISCGNDPERIREVYEKHRLNRNARFKDQILHSGFPGWQVDEILQKLDATSDDETRFLDTRNNCAFWARPPQHIRDLVYDIQQEIRAVAPTLWFMPLDRLHMTTLEIISARTPAEVEGIASSLKQSGSLHEIVNYTLAHRARLVKPMVSYDASAIAVSFVPAAGDADNSPQSAEDDKYTYHHLRRDLFDIVTGKGCPIAARYTVPSAHLTIARFITQDGFLLEDSGPGARFVDRERIALFVDTIEKINQKLQANYSQREDSPSQGDWLVGQEKGLELIKGRSWYGKGDSVLIGEGFT